MSPARSSGDRTRSPVIRIEIPNVLRPRGILASLLLVLVSSGPLVAQVEGPERIALVGGMLLDGYETSPVHDAAVLIEGNRIVAVGPESEMDIPQGTRVIDTNGMTMLPGLVDLHVHLMIVGHGEYDDWFPIFEQRKQEIMAISARQLLEAGVTTAVDLGGPIEIIATRDAISAGRIPGPRLLVSGPWVTRYTGSWPTFFQYRITSPEEAGERAQELVDRGVDLIKTWAGMTEQDIRAVVAVAHRNGLQVHSHVYSPEAIRAAIRAGTDVLQHAGSGGNPPYPEDLVMEIAHRGIPVVQTIAHRIWVYPATEQFPERLDDSAYRAYFPADLYREIKGSFKNFHRLSYFRTTPRQIRNSRIAARQFIEAGAVMAMGTDSGSPLNFHTESAWREIEALVDSGMTPLQAISISTLGGARVLRLGDEIGTVEPGKLADILVVDGNPLADIRDLGRVVHVVKDGVLY